MANNRDRENKWKVEYDVRLGKPLFILIKGEDNRGTISFEADDNIAEDIEDISDRLTELLWDLQQNLEKRA